MNDPQRNPEKQDSHQSPRGRIILPLFVTALVVVALFVAVDQLALRIDAGTPVYDQEKPQAVLEIAQILLAYYQDLAKVVTAAFGVVAFLVTYRQKSAVTVPRYAWTLLAAGVGAIALALVITYASADALVTMISQNAIDLGLSRFKHLRLLSYGLLALSGVFIAFYAATLVTQPVPGRASTKSGKRNGEG